MTPKQFSIVKKSTYGILAATLGVSVMWLSTGGSILQSSIVSSVQADVIAANEDLGAMHSAANDNLYSSLGTSDTMIETDTVVPAQQSVDPLLSPSTAPSARATISNELATYRQTITAEKTEVSVNSPTTNTVYTATSVPDTVPTTGPSEVIFFLLSGLMAIGLFVWHKKTEQQ